MVDLEEEIARTKKELESAEKELKRQKTNWRTKDLYRRLLRR